MFWHVLSNWSRIQIQNFCLDPELLKSQLDPGPEEIIPDSQHWSVVLRVIAGFFNKRFVSNLPAQFWSWLVHGTGLFSSGQMFPPHPANQQIILCKSTYECVVLFIIDIK